MTCQLPATSSVTTTTMIPVDMGAPSSEDGSGSSIIILVASMCMCLWVFIVLVILRYRRNTKSLERARNMVLGTHGDLTFGAPEPLRRNKMTVMNELFAGGEIDPETGVMNIYGATPGPEGGGGNMTDDLWGTGAGAMPSAWGGVKGNPLFNINDATTDGSNSQSDGYLTAHPDSLDGDDVLADLDNFEEADFESFADSLLAESEEAFEQELFGSSAPSDARRQQRDSLTAPDGAWGGLANNLASAGIQIELDDLSDFENSDMEADDFSDDTDSSDDHGAVVADRTYNNVGASVSTPNSRQDPGPADSANDVWAAFAGRTSTYMGGDM